MSGVTTPTGVLGWTAGAGAEGHGSLAALWAQNALAVPSLPAGAQATCQIGTRVWTPAWALLCLSQVRGEGGGPFGQGECNLPTTEPARKEISRLTEVLPLCLVGYEGRGRSPGPRQPLLLHPRAHFWKRLHSASKTPKSRATCPVPVAPLAFPTEQPQQLSGI